MARVPTRVAVLTLMIAFDFGLHATALLGVRLAAFVSPPPVAVAISYTEFWATYWGFALAVAASLAVTYHSRS